MEHESPSLVRSLRSLVTALALTALGASACVGKIGPAGGGDSQATTPGGNTPGGNTPGGTTPGGTTPGGNTPGGTTPDPTAANCSGIAAGVPANVPLQRMNGTQYAEIISELFGSTITAPTTFPTPLTGYAYSTYSGANPMGEGQVQNALDAAEAVAMQVADHIPACASVAMETSCATSYLQTLANRAFRRTTTSAELTLILGSYSRARTAAPFADSVALGVETILQMPQFLYVLEDQPASATAQPTTLTGPQLATRMALLYWNGLPDQALLDAAQSGALADPANRFTQAQRMLQDPRAHAVFSDFLRQWMTIQGFKADVHAADLQAALDEEMRRDIDHALAANSGLADLLSSSQTQVNSVLEKFYGLPAQSTGPTDWHMVDLGADRRVGILTHPMLLAKFAHGLTASPILRGKFVRVMVMCDDIQPPPPGAQAMQDSLSAPGASIKEQSQARLNNAVCGGCHTLMDPIGFGFSAFDGAGTYQATVNGQPVDTSGHVTSGAPGLNGDFVGVRQLGDKLVNSPKVQACMASQWLRYAFGAQETAADACTVQALAARFAQQSNSLNALFAGISALDAFAQRRSPEVKP